MTEPIFTKLIQGRMYLTPGTTHVLECAASGLPAPKITWYHQDVVLSETKHITFSEDKTRYIYELNILKLIKAKRLIKHFIMTIIV